MCHCLSDGPDNMILTPPYTQYTANVSTIFRNISCTAMCYPSCSYTWRKQGSVSDLVTTNGVLELEILDKDEAGVYVCTASNIQLAGSATAVFILHVRCKCRVK